MFERIFLYFTRFIHRCHRWDFGLALSVLREELICNLGLCIIAYCIYMHVVRIPAILLRSILTYYDSCHRTYYSILGVLSVKVSESSPTAIWIRANSK
jgi:hypothetical protein